MGAHDTNARLEGSTRGARSPDSSTREAAVGRAIRRAERSLLEHALAFPGAWEDHPWGETVVKVGTRIFVFFGRGEDGKGLGLSVKLPASADLALSLPFAQPTGYGLGKHGWVTARFGRDDEPPLELLRQWIDESFRAVAPKRVVARMGE
jgi:predicted DNA-binding protein (MmcQ/YjbR family)